MKGHGCPHGPGLLVSVIEDESQKEKREDGLELEVNEGKEHRGKDAGEPEWPGLGESAVDEATEEKFFEQGCKDGNDEEGHGEPNGIVAKERKVGFLFAEAREAEAGVVQNGGDGEGDHEVESVTEQNGFYEQPRGDFFETEIGDGESVFITTKSH